MISGIGINVNNPSFPEDIGDKATSLFIETGAKWDREELIKRVIHYLKKYLDQYSKERDLGFIVDAYNSMLVNMNREVILYTDDSGVSTTGERYISRGIDKNGALLIEDSRGEVTSVISGEVSVRGLYGYV